MQPGGERRLAAKGLDLPEELHKRFLREVRPDSIGSWEHFADETPMKQTARQMMRMVDQINRDNFGGRRVLTCYSCHRGGDRPRLTPTVEDIYDPPPPPQPDKITRGPASPDAAEILDRYIQALGGTQRLGLLRSFIAGGTEQEFGELAKNPVEIYAQAPGKQTTITKTQNGLRTMVCDGSFAWVAPPYEDRPVPLLPLSGGELDGARLDALVAFPRAHQATAHRLARRISV